MSKRRSLPLSTLIRFDCINKLIECFIQCVQRNEESFKWYEIARSNCLAEQTCKVISHGGCWPWDCRGVSWSLRGMTSTRQVFLLEPSSRSLTVRGSSEWNSPARCLGQCRSALVCPRQTICEHKTSVTALRQQVFLFEPSSLSLTAWVSSKDGIV